MKFRFFIRALLLLLTVAGSIFAAAPAPVALATPGIENFFRLTPRLYSGGVPEGDAAFAALKMLGIKTILSVDGLAPKVARAEKFGLRYVHLPHGYDGISSNTIAGLVKAAQNVEGPIFVHCHHGKHRAPAAAGVICQATEGWNGDDAIAWLKRAGTSPEYAGLYRANADFRAPTETQLALVPTNFPSRARVSDIVDAMVEMDRRWDNLKAIQQAGWRVPPNQLDLVPATEALLLQEACRELLRATNAQSKGTGFLDHLRRTEQSAANFHALLKASPLSLGDDARSRAAELTKTIGQTCTDCHRRHRD